MISPFESNLDDWATEQFAGSCSEDPRLQRRAMQYAKLQAADPTGSTARVCGGDKAAQMGAYRFLGNPRVKASSIDQGPFEATARACAGRARVLCIQDTTSVSVVNADLRAELASVGSPTGFAAHTAVMVDGATGEYLGAIAQERWLRKGTQKRFQGSVESEKWARANTAVRGRISMKNVVMVGDREADFLSFLHDKAIDAERFVIRAKWNRSAWREMNGIFAAVKIAPIVGQRTITIEQRGSVPKKGIEPGRNARQRRDVVTNLQACQKIVIDHATALPPLEINIVRVSAVDNTDCPESKESLEWYLLTSEPIDTFEDIMQIVKDYEHRWVIEELHKVWKTGCRVEGRPLQSVESVETMMALTLPIAGRLLALHTAARSDAIDQDVTTPLSDNELQCLWRSTEKAPYPQKRPNSAWAVMGIAKLGGWYDSKRTGRIGWQTLWHGWDIFSQRLSGWNDALQLRKVRLV